MIFKDIYKSANSEIEEVKDELIKDIIFKIENRKVIKRRLTNRKLILRFGVVLACLVIVLGSISLMINIYHKPIENNIGSRIGSTYLRYNGKYYANYGPFIIIPDNEISKKIYDHDDSFYEIKGVSTDKSIAVSYGGRKYVRYDYEFDDSITFNGEPYLLNPNSADYCYTSSSGQSIYKIGDYLGKVGQFEIYSITDAEISEKVVLKLNGNPYNQYIVAEQLLSSVDLNGINYVVQSNIIPIQSNETGEFIGMAGPYKAYKCNLTYKGPKTIILHINDTQQVYAFDATLK